MPLGFFVEVHLRFCMNEPIPVPHTETAAALGRQW